MADKDPTTLSEDERTTDEEIGIWISYNQDLRKAGYDAYGKFYLMYSEDPVRMGNGVKFFREYGDTIAEIYDPQDGYSIEELIGEIPKDDPAMFYIAMKEAENFYIKQDDEVKEVDTDEVSNEELMDFVLDYYDRIKDEPSFLYANEFEKNYGKLQEYDFLGDWHKASEEIDSKKLYL